MKILLNFCLLILTIFSYSQNLAKSDIIGDWKVYKSKLFLNERLVKTSYAKENSEIVINGQNLGPYNEKLNLMVRAMTESKITFEDNNYCSWNIKLADLGFENKYYEVSNLNEVNIRSLEVDNKNKKIIQFKIEQIDDNNGVLTSNDSGFGFKLYIARDK